MTQERMSHLDGDRLVLFALGEQAPTAEEREHLATCASCRDDLSGLTEVTAIGRETREVADLPMPPPRVWDQIAAATIGTVQAPTAEPKTPAQPGRRRVSRVLVAAVAAAVLGIVGTVGVGHVVQRLQPPTAEPQTTLAACGDTPPAAHGRAELLQRDGQTTLRIEVADLPPAPGYYEVWLIDPGTLRMISVGVLGGQSEVALPLPSTVDISTYRLVDVSAGAYDNNPAHSGHSLLRGLL